MTDTMTVTRSGNGARLVSVEGIDLPLRGVTIRAQAKGGLARCVVSQIFFNGHDQPIKATYTMPLPPTGAVGAYQFVIGDRRVSGEIAPWESARRQFEQALIDGKTASLLDQERVNLFTQDLGNIPPHTEISVEITIDQRLDWLAEGLWEWRFPTVAAPRYLGAEGRVGDGAKVTVDVTSSTTGTRAQFELLVEDALDEGRLPESPSHRIDIEDGALSRVTPAEGQGVALDRDLVVRWPVARRRAGLSIQMARPDLVNNGGHCAYGLLTIVPPCQDAAGAIPRDLIVLLDTSGSMQGRPLAAAKRVVETLIDSLTEVDRLEMIAFATEPRPWRAGPVVMTTGMRSDALQWVSGLAAGGGTEMLGALEEALRPLREGAQRQVVLVTDGLIGFESEIVSALCRRLPASSRLHAVGIGSAVNDALLAPAARAGRGVKVVVGLDEDAAHGAARLVAATRAPVVTEIEVSGSALIRSAPRRLTDLMAGAPVLVCVETRSEGGELIVRGRTADGVWEQRVTTPAVAPGTGNPGVTASYARELVEDLEMDLAAGSRRIEIDAEIERVGMMYGISTRMTSWVAISEVPTVDPRQPVRRVAMPQALPYGVSAEGLGLFRDARPITLSTNVFEAGDLEVMELNEVDETSFGLADKLAQDLLSFKGSRRLRREGTVSGRWAGTLGPDLQVLEFEVRGTALDWVPPLAVLVESETGEELEVGVERDACTLAGKLAPGSLVRLVLRLVAGAQERIIMVMPASPGDRFPTIRIDP